MSLALEILEARKQADWFGMSTFGGGPTNYQVIRDRRARGERTNLLPSLGGVTLPARMAPEPIPAHIQEAKNRSLANRAQVQNVMQAVGGRGAAPAAELSQAERDARHATTINTLKAVEASRMAPKLPLPKVACFTCPALEVMRSRAS
jgi:hypothetical protein